MKFIFSYKKFESKNITSDQFSSFDNPDIFTKRELDLLEEYSKRNTWDYYLRSSLKSIEIFINKKQIDCDIVIEKQQDEY